MRKVIIFFTILLIAFLGYFSYKLLEEKEIAVNSLIDAVPFDATTIVEINRPELLFNIIYNPPIDAESFLSIPYIKNPMEKLKAIDSIASENQKVRSFLRRPHSSVISGHQVGKDELEWIFYLKLNSKDEFPLIDELIRKNVRAKGNISRHTYEDAHINDVSIFNRKSGGFSYTYYQGMIILSKSSILVEEVIRQSRTGISIKKKAGLETVMKTAGKSTPFNLYVNFDYFPEIALNFIHPRFKPELQAVGKFAHWIELDFNIDRNAIVLNGFSTVENTTGFLSDIFREQEPVEPVLPGLLPSGTQSFFSMAITDYAKFRVNFSDYQKKNLPNPDFDQNLMAFKKSEGFDLETEFIKAFDDEICMAYYPVIEEALENNIFTVIKTKGNPEARQFITQVSPAPVQNTGDPQSTVYHIPSYNIPRLLFGNIFGLNKNSHCIISDNFIIFGDSLNHLVGFAKDFAQQKNLSLDLNYRNLTDLLSEDAYCYFYLSPDAEQFYRHFLRYTSDQMLSQYKYGLSQVQAMVYQFGRNNDLFYNNAFIQFATKPEGNITRLWEVKLDNSLVSAIHLVKNHSTTESEIVCQDKANNLYLISHDGKILWKRPIGSRISGDISQADLFRNQKLQLLFNTADQIWALDRNGKTVEGFPVKLPRKAISGMAVFDYDKTRNYRFLITLNDHRLYCFDQHGKEVKGWEKPATGLQPGKIRHFAIHGKDFLVIWDENKIQFFDRKGRERITGQPIRVAPNSGVFKSNNHFVTTDSSGTIYLIALNGTSTKIKTGIYPFGHYYFPADADFNQTDDHLFFYGKKMEAYSGAGARVLNLPLNGVVDLPPKIIYNSDSTFLLSYTDTTERKIFLENNLGNSLAGSPLQGNSEVFFKISENNGKILNLYYGNNNILSCISVK